ncbi:cupin domain-containing protein [Pseudonocardia acaciae]|uniref:cupin domain-containing protein n=1 Tax=Pseudonocardia acaciae TaxID=551276 RepID=UPI000560260C|nr:cupin domain-containing protein [Pseudonocardia acaciae]
MVSQADPGYDVIHQLCAAPLWRYYGNLFTAEPRGDAVPFLWRYAELRPHLLHFAEELSMEEAERRVLMLVNPGMPDPPATVATLYAGIQVIMPGETAQAHRHTANAFRFVIEGNGAHTTVDGERVTMRPGDLLLTPGWRWHDHHHRGEGPMIWLDALDYPLVNALGAGFFELHGQRSQKTTMPDDLSTRQFTHGHLVPAWSMDRTVSSPVGNYPWEQTRRAFESIADDAEGSATDGVILEYTNPWTGGPVLPTMACRVQRLRPGFHGEAVRRTSSSIHHVIRGTGAVVADGKRLDWHDKDVFALPGWTTRELINTSGTEDAIVFSYSNEPVLRALGMYREESVERQG